MKVGGAGPISGVRPTTRRADRGVRTEKGATSVRSVADTVSIFGIPEDEMTPRVRSAIMRLMTEVDRLRVEMEHTLRRLGETERLANLDPLAPISNRRAFVRELTRMIAFTDRYGTPSSLIYMDLNDLKAINDRYGHAAGDAAIVHFARVLLENVRESDFVGRLGGDEFGVILVQADENTARKKAEVLSAKIMAAPFEWQGNRIELGFAHGVYSFRQGEDADRAMAEADKAMYERKRDMKSSK